MQQVTEMASTAPRKRKLSLSKEEKGKSKVPRIEEPKTPNTSAPPQEVRVMDFIKNRVKEIGQLEQAIKVRINSTTLLFQRLPRHMRRRAMSHNIKRLPVRLRQMARHEYQKRGNVDKARMRSRKHRRRPSNLLSEYQRRQRRVRWLETHIWHAKRFKMVERWGWRLPLQPTMRGERAAYRAAARHCLLQDISFMSCLEVSGPQRDITAALKPLFSEKAGPTIAGRGVLQGQREGEAMLYQAGCFPHGALARVSFLWNPTTAAEPGREEGRMERQLWLWCHPASFGLVWQQVLQAAQRLAPPGDGGAEHAGAANGEMPASTEMDPGVGPVGCRSSSKSIGTLSVRSLWDQLVRFRLTGPVSGEVLREALEPAEVENAGLQSAKREGVGAQRGGTGTEHWWRAVYQDPKMAACHVAQGKLWASLSSRPPAGLPPHQVVALTVRDPRVLLPERRLKVMSSSEDRGGSSGDAVGSMATCQSPLWREDVRCQTRSSMLSVLELNREREKLLVPGSPLLLGDRESRVPVILIQQPGGRGSPGGERGQLGMGAGWDLVAPGGWGMGFLLALVLRGARPGGLRDGAAVALEAACLHFPSDFPDTPAGQEMSHTEKEGLQDKHQRRPPAKRPNFVKLGNPCPFACPWELLARQWAASVDLLSSDRDVPSAAALAERGKIQSSSNSKSLADGSAMATGREQEGNAQSDMPVVLNGGDKKEGNMFVLRDRKFLKLLAAATAPHLRNLRNNQKLSSLKCRLALLKKDVDLKSLCLELPLAIVPVHIQMTLRGVPEKLAHICLPTQADIAALQADKTYAGPLEPCHPDPGKAARRKEKERKVKKVNQTNETVSKDASASGAEAEGCDGDEQRKGPKSKGEKPAESSKETKTGGKADDGAVAELTKTDAEKALQKTDLLSCCSRPMVGFVNKGSFALGTGEGCGLGFCSLIGLLHLLQAMPLDKPVTVLIRNPKSLQYRFATLSVLV